MPARAYWTGRIRLSLVSIPIQLYSTTKSGARISFNQIHEPSGKRIRYEKVVPGIGPIDTGEIVKGYEVEKGKYVLLTDEEIDEVKLEAKRTIDLVQFVGEDEIDPVYFENSYFVAPEDDEDGQEAYVVLRDALKKEKKIGLGQIVIRGKGAIVAIRAEGKGLLLQTLHYADEVQKADPFYQDVPARKPDSEMISLATELIEKKTRKFDPKEFHDKYTDALKELIEAKQEKRAPRQIEEAELPSNVINLMDALKRSVGKKGESAKEDKKPAKRTKRAAKSAAKSARRSAKRSKAA
ncbi:MAG: Ku protein [Xanthobacteraceae bacterium]|nr:Ku protein [Xanthobacteraceae bacterium]MBX3533931.1 Ku protein [Xanthobacteraceae bacterium]MBX3547779.1 Ku protein [Xanthobacteraceae bacterium]MCW5674793.1 Ku protein [Xanthobacteraceae bacterium]MCW5677142.1 Ku protein [Xanthobacteraceae bacterium]